MTAELAVAFLRVNTVEVSSCSRPIASSLSGVSKFDDMVGVSRSNEFLDEEINCLGRENCKKLTLK